MVINFLNIVRIICIEITNACQFFGSKSDIFIGVFMLIFCSTMGLFSFPCLFRLFSYLVFILSLLLILEAFDANMSKPSTFVTLWLL